MYNPPHPKVGQLMTMKIADCVPLKRNIDLKKLVIPVARLSIRYSGHTSFRKVLKFPALEAISGYV